MIRSHDDLTPQAATDGISAGLEGVFGPEEAGHRLDKALAGKVPALSRSRLQALVLAGQVFLDGRVETDPSVKLKPGQRFALAVPPATDPAPRGQEIPLAVVYEDGDLIVIDKPPRLVVHPAAGHAEGTLVNALIAHCGRSLSGIGGVRRPGIVHRLDKDTSGLLVVAKNDAAHAALSAQFADHGRTGPLERAYLALVWGAPRRASRVIHTWIDRSPRNREKMAVSPEGKGREAITHYTVLRTFPAQAETPVASLIRCELETGRTHQIRVHLAHVGCPLMGDDVYGSGFATKAARLPEGAARALAALGRQALHAALLGFVHPSTGETLTFESAPPPDFAALQDQLSQL